jgi:hypothetical protein
MELRSAAEPQPTLEFTLQRAAGDTLKRELQRPDSSHIRSPNGPGAKKFMPLGSA